MSKYDAKKALDYPYSSIQWIMEEYVKQGIVISVSERTARTGLTINYYQLSETGRLLLELARRLDIEH